MDITFNTPYGFSSDSTPEENRTANRILGNIVNRLNAVRSGASSSLRRTGRCLFTFDLPSLFCTESTPVQDGYALQILLEGLINLNRAYLLNRSVPDLYRSGVVYGRTEIWDTIPALYERKTTMGDPLAYGDCKSVTAALVAEYLKKGRECMPVFRWIKTDIGTKDYHILVLTPEGFEDPSKVLGMGTNENAAINPGSY